MGYVLPIVNRALDIRTQLYLRSHPRVTLNQSQTENIHRLLSPMHERMEIEGSADIQDNQRIILTELIKSIAETLCFESVEHLRCQSAHRRAAQRPQRHRVSELHDFPHQLPPRTQRGFLCRRAVPVLQLFLRHHQTEIRNDGTPLISNAVISDARHILEYTNMSIKEIANRLNFPTQSFSANTSNSMWAYRPRNTASASGKGWKRA